MLRKCITMLSNRPGNGAIVSSNKARRIHLLYVNGLKTNPLIILTIVINHQIEYKANQSAKFYGFTCYIFTF
jgi:hypothetical protein